MAKKQSHKAFVKEIKGPDEYQRVASRVLNWVNKNTMVIWATIVPIVLVVVGVLIWQWYAQQQQTKLVNALGEVNISYIEETKKAQTARAKFSDKMTEIDTQIAAIETPKPKGKVDPKKPAKKHKVTTSEKKKIKVLKAERTVQEEKMNLIKADHSASLTEFLAFFDMHSETPQGWVANMQAVSIYLEQKKNNEAKELLAKLMEKSKSSVFYQTYARIIYVNLLKDGGEFDLALSETAKLEKSANDQIKALVLLGKAQILTLKGDKDEAIKVLDIIQQDHANTPEADQAKNFRLIVKGV